MLFIMANTIFLYCFFSFCVAFSVNMVGCLCSHLLIKNKKSRQVAIVIPLKTQTAIFKSSISENNLEVNN